MRIIQVSVTDSRLATSCYAEDGLAIGIGPLDGVPPRDTALPDSDARPHQADKPCSDARSSVRIGPSSARPNPRFATGRRIDDE